MNEAQRSELVERLGRLLGMYSTTFPNTSAEDQVTTLTLCLMTFRDLSVQEAVSFIRANREDINDAMRRSAFIGDVRRDLDNLDVQEDGGEELP